MANASTTSTAAAASRYTAKDIEVLEGLEPVRARPAMCIGGTDVRGYHHLLWEIVDNAVDEAINGHAKRIEVTLDDDRRGVTVSDDGRGIPVDVHPKYHRPALELILCTLHAGGKFASSNYKVSGGLHGVGSSVVNALSDVLDVKVLRDGYEHTQSFSRGVATGKLKRGQTTRKHGTVLHFRPDAKIFGDKATFDVDVIKERLEAKAYLHGGLVISFKDPANNESLEFLHPNGIADYLPKLVAQRGKSLVHPSPFIHRHTAPGGELLEAALCWTESPDESLRSYVNGIPTHSGGSHEGGFNTAIVKAVRAFIEAKKIQVKGVTLAAEDIREGIVGLLSIYIQNPQFQGQTKDRLNNSEAGPLVESAVRPALEQWLLENGTVGEAIVMRGILHDIAPGTAFENALRIEGLIMHGNHQNGQTGNEGEHILDEFETIAARKSDVHGDHVGARAFERREGLGHTAGGPADFHVGLGINKLFEPLTHHGVIVHNGDSFPVGSATLRD